ncbi:MAG: archaetidylserine decarboxylase [Planctomycetota bacterium]
MAAASPRFYHRYRQQTETEAIYGESALRWAYETAAGRGTLWALLRRPAFSRYYGWRMNRPASRRRIAPFIAEFELDPEEFAQPVESYATFNEFFYRELRPEARPLRGDEHDAVFPADGRHRGVPDLAATGFLYAKGQQLSVVELLGDRDLGARFAGGSAIISRLCPTDYHRFHAPVAGDLTRQVRLPGPLYSVNPIALARRITYLWQNARVVSLIEGSPFGAVAFVAIGATCVGTIAMTKTPGQTVARGDELGYFAFGGSCVITVFEPGAAQLAEDLLRAGDDEMELYAQVRDLAARATSA